MGIQPSQQKFNEWIEKVWIGSKKCPICESEEWLVCKISEVREYGGGSFNVGSPVMPVIPVICNICGYTMLFNAIKMGIIRLMPG